MKKLLLLLLCVPMIGLGQYTGCVSGDCKKGSGTWTFKDRHGEYVGEFKKFKKKGMYHGTGTYTWDNRDKYVGEWKKGMRHGTGTLTYVNGDEYVGEWKDDKKNGKGTFIFTNNGNKYEGEFIKDMIHGKGTFTWENGDMYKGEWNNNKEHGQGTMTYADETIEQGLWENGEFIGE